MDSSVTPQHAENTTPNWACFLPDLVGGPAATQFLALQKPTSSAYLPKVSNFLSQKAYRVPQKRSSFHAASILPILFWFKTVTKREIKEIKQFNLNKF